MTTDKLTDEQIERLREAASGESPRTFFPVVANAVIAMADELLRLRAGVARAEEIADEARHNHQIGVAEVVEQVLKGFK